MNRKKSILVLIRIVMIIIYVLLSLYLCLVLSIIEKYDLNMFYKLHSSENAFMSCEDYSLAYTKVPCFMVTIVIIMCCSIVRQKRCMTDRIQHLVTMASFVIIGTFNIYLVLVTLIINSHFYANGYTDYLSIVTRFESPIILLYDIITLVIIIVGKSTR